MRRPTLSSLRRQADPNAAKAAALLARARAIVGGSGPVLAGPWRGDLGYELLYWVPFLRYLVEVEPSLRDRLTVVSRGGVASWYGDVASGYADVFEHVGVDELREATAGRDVVGHKQRDVDPADELVLERVRAALGLDGARLLGSGIASELMRFTKKDAFALGAAMLRYRRIVPPTTEVELPERFVAARFYASAQLPSGGPNERIVAALLEELSGSIPVVAIGNPFPLDGHRDFPLPSSVTVVSAPDVRDNLAFQTAVLGRAASFVGTYGGLSYLAPFLGVPSTALFSVPESITQVYLRLAVFAAQSVDAPYRVLDVAERPGIDVLAALGRAVASTP